MQKYTLPAVLLAVFGAIVWFSASPKAAPPVAAAGAHEVPLMVSSDAVNYMHDWGVIYTLIDTKSNQPIGGAILGFLEGPGGKGCCVSLPQRWQPGIKLTVSWRKSNADMTEDQPRVKTLELPRYTQPGDVYVLFYPNDDVEIVASPVEPGHAGWPGRIKAGAWNACVARLSEKECKKNLPKYAPGSPEEGAALVRRSCQKDALAQSSDPKRDILLCEKWVNDCLAKGEIDKKMCQLDYKEE